MKHFWLKKTHYLIVLHLLSNFGRFVYAVDVVIKARFPMPDSRFVEAFYSGFANTICCALKHLILYCVFIFKGIVGFTRVNYVAFLRHTHQGKRSRAFFCFPDR